MNLQYLLIMIKLHNDKFCDHFHLFHSIHDGSALTDAVSRLILKIRNFLSDGVTLFPYKAVGTSWNCFLLNASVLIA